MTDTFTYTTVSAKIPNLLKKIRETAVPAKATVAWLKTLGFTSSNDPSLLNVLRQIGFIDTAGVPQPAWKEYRGADYKNVLGRAIALGYATLYATYPDAHLRSGDDLVHIFATNTTAGKGAVNAMLATYNHLVKEASFDAPSTLGNAAAAGSRHADPEGVASRPEVALKTQSANGLTININVALTLPDTSDPKVFEALFSSMRKHLIDDNLP